MTQPAEPTPMYVLEAAAPLARSMVWHLQRTFYADQGIEAWTRSKVPQSVTTSPMIARAYARIVQGYLRDIQPVVDPHEPVYIVELGAGSGRFAYRFLKDFDQAGVRYVMTDASSSVMAFWRDNPRLRPFVESQVLDFAHFDLLAPAPPVLQNTGVTLSDLANPVIVIANYIFDSIPQDAFTIKDRQLFANLVTVSASTPQLDLTAPDSRVRIHIGFTEDDTPTDVETEPDPVLRDILRSYRERLHDTTVLIPRAAMACVRFFSEIGRRRLLCVISDFGDAREDDLNAHGPPGFGAGGGLWLAVNFHALGEFAHGLGGYGRHPRNRAIRLNTTMLLVDSKSDKTFPETELAYASTIDDRGPDALSLLTGAFGEAEVPLSVEAILALLRTTRWDSDYLLRCIPALLDALPKVEQRLRQELLTGIHEAWEQYYPIGEPNDFPFALGALLYALEHYAEALRFFETSLGQFGEDPRTTLNLALTLHRLERMPEAAHWVDRTLALEPTNESAIELRRTLSAEL